MISTCYTIFNFSLRSIPRGYARVSVEAFCVKECFLFRFPYSTLRRQAMPEFLYGVDVFLYLSFCIFTNLVHTFRWQYRGLSSRTVPHLSTLRVIHAFDTPHFVCLPSVTLVFHCKRCFVFLFEFTVRFMVFCLFSLSVCLS